MSNYRRVRILLLADLHETSPIVYLEERQSTASTDRRHHCKKVIEDSLDYYSMNLDNSCSSHR